MANNPTDMTHWLSAPNAMKPGNMMTIFIHDGQLPPQEVQDLTAYLESLK
jgi:cytochrome c2